MPYLSIFKDMYGNEDYGEWDDLYHNIQECVNNFRFHTPNKTNSSKLMDDPFSPRMKGYMVMHRNYPKFIVYCDVIYSVSIKKQQEFEELVRSGYNGLHQRILQTGIDGDSLRIVIKINPSCKSGDLGLQMSNIVRLYKQLETKWK